MLCGEGFWLKGWVGVLWLMLGEFCVLLVSVLVSSIGSLLVFIIGVSEVLWKLLCVFCRWKLLLLLLWFVFI